MSTYNFSLTNGKSGTVKVDVSIRTIGTVLKLEAASDRPLSSNDVRAIQKDIGYDPDVYSIMMKPVSRMDGARHTVYWEALGNSD